MVAYDVVVTVDGAYPSLAEAESRWSSAHVSQERKDVGLQRLRIDSGQIAWTRPFGEQTRLPKCGKRFSQLGRRETLECRRPERGLNIEGLEPPA